MAKFRVYLERTDSCVVEVEADDASAAIDAAYEAELPTLCAGCSGWGTSVVVDEGDWDVSEEEPEQVEDDE